MKDKFEKVLCKRSLIIGDTFYWDFSTDPPTKIGRDNKMLVTGDWYDVVFNKHDTKETFSIIDNQNHLHLFFIYKDDTNHKLPRTYAKWFYTPKELEKRKARQYEKPNI